MQGGGDVFELDYVEWTLIQDIIGHGHGQVSIAPGDVVYNELANSNLKNEILW